MNYTKGEWQVYTGHDGQFVDEPYIIADPHRSTAQECSPTIAHVLYTLNQTEANARLIAAAPDMYECLQKALLYVNIYAHGDNVARLLQEEFTQALDKAEGK
jgi:hypothetical protein